MCSVLKCWEICHQATALPSNHSSMNDLTRTLLIKGCQTSDWHSNLRFSLLHSFPSWSVSLRRRVWIDVTAPARSWSCKDKNTCCQRAAALPHHSAVYDVALILRVWIARQSLQDGCLGEEITSTHTSMHGIHTACWLRLLTGCRPNHHHHLPLCLFLVQYYRLEPPTANQQAASLFCHQPVLEEGIGLCDLSLEGRWNARSAQPLGTSRLPYNGNQHSLGSGAITSSSVQENRGLHLFCFFFPVCCSVVYLHVEKGSAAGGLCHSPVLIIHPLWNRLNLLLSILHQRAAFWNLSPPCTITCTFMDLKTRRRWVDGRLTLVHHASCVVSWPVDPFMNTYGMRWDFSGLSAHSSRGSRGRLGEGCAWSVLVCVCVCWGVCVCVCVFDRASVWGLLQPTVQFSRRMMALLLSGWSVCRSKQRFSPTSPYGRLAGAHAGKRLHLCCSHLFVGLLHHIPPHIIEVYGKDRTPRPPESYWCAVASNRGAFHARHECMDGRYTSDSLFKHEFAFHHTRTQVMAHTDRTTHTAFDSERPAVLLSGHPRERNVSEQRKNAYKGNKCGSCCGVEGRRESHWARICQDLSITPADILAALWRLKAGGVFFTHRHPSTGQV